MTDLVLRVHIEIYHYLTTHIAIEIMDTQTILHLSQVAVQIKPFHSQAIASLSTFVFLLLFVCISSMSGMRLSEEPLK